MAYCFNHGLKNPTADSRYKMLVTTPELLYTYALNKSDDISEQDLYDHVLAAIYHSEECGALFGLDEVETRYITYIAIKSYTDPMCFRSFDDDGNAAYPNGTVWGSVINHAKRSHEKNNLNTEYPAYREAYYKLIGKTECESHPADYYLYIYYPENWAPNNTDVDQCLLSAFTAPPVRATVSVRQTTEIEIHKTWDDADNKDRLRPESITVHLFADGTEIDSATVEPDVNGNWSYTFNHHPKFNDDGQEIVYTVTEDPVTKYDTEINGYSIINHQLIDIPVTKTWDDDNDRDGVRPDQIVIHLFADGKEIDTATVTPDENGDWSYTFANLQKYRDGGVEIVYTVTEDAVDEYGTEIEGYGITNTHEPETTEIEIRKVWDGADNQDGLRPESITVNLLADGETVQTVSVTPDENGDWSYTFTDLPKYRDGGIEIVYTVTEETVASYRTEINGFTITNRHVPGTVDIPVAKTWDDDDNRDGLRPDRITVNLLADGVIARSVEITPDEGGNWAYTFTDLPIYQDGIKIVYSIAEEPVAEYETDVTAFDILNTHEPETTEIEIRKVWDDADNQDGLRPESITVNLLADGETVQTVSVRPDENGEWSYTFTGLPKYRDGGIEIVYTVTEDAVEAYMTEIDGYSLTNRHVPGAVDIKVEKIWVDSDNKYNSRPDSITVNLLADGEIIRTVIITPDKDGNWTHVFKDLPKYKGGAEISYTVTEEPVSGYSSSVDGYCITNIYTPPTGDSFNPTLLFVLAGASLAALAAVIIIMRRRKPTK